MGTSILSSAGTRHSGLECCGCCCPPTHETDTQLRCKPAAIGSETSVVTLVGMEIAGLSTPATATAALEATVAGAG